MDKEQAKSILRNYRPGETELLSKQTQEALAMARNDPELATWFGRHCAAVAQTSGRTPTPATSLDSEKPTPDAETEAKAAGKNRVRNISLGVVVAMLIAGLVLYLMTPPKPENTLANFRSQMANLAQHSFPMKTPATGLDQIREYFRTNSGAPALELPRNLEKLPGHGAAVFQWHNQPVSLVGFDAGGETNLYLFLADSPEIIDPPAKGKTEWVVMGQLMTVCWTSGMRVYLLAGPNDEALLKSLLE